MIRIMPALITLKAANQYTREKEKDILSLSLSLSLRFSGHFPGEPGLAGVY